MSATGQGQAAGGDAGGEGQAQGFDAAALQQQLQQTAGGVDELRQQFGQFIESAPWQPQETAEAEPEPELDLSMLDSGLYDPGYGEQDRAQAQQQMAAQIQEAIDRRVQQALGPQQERIAEMQREQEARDLIAMHPELQDPEIAQQVVRDAQEVAHEMGQPELGMNPKFWRIVYQAQRATQTANDEGNGADAPRAAHLEGGGGAGPAGGGQVDIADQILGARKGSSVLPFQ
jgi:hypothetical protein